MSKYNDEAKAAAPVTVLARLEELERTVTNHRERIHTAQDRIDALRRLLGTMEDEPESPVF